MGDKLRCALLLLPGREDNHFDGGETCIVCAALQGGAVPCWWETNPPRLVVGVCDAALLGWAGTVPFACRQRVVGDGWVSR